MSLRVARCLLLFSLAWSLGCARGSSAPLMGPSAVLPAGAQPGLRVYPAPALIHALRGPKSSLLRSCAEPRASTHVAESPELPHGSFLLEQTVDVVHGAHRAVFDLAVQRDEDTLTILGLHAFGARIFVLQVVAEEVRFTSYDVLPFALDPVRLAAQVWAVLVAHCCAPCADGMRTFEAPGVVMRTLLRDGRAFERTVDAGQGSRFRMHFRGAPEPIVSREVLLEDLDDGTRVRIYTNTQRAF